MSAYFAMLVPVPSAGPAGHDDDGPEPEGEALAARVAAGPGLWEDEGWLGELRRDGLIGELLAGGVIARAVAGGGHGHRLERALTAAMTMLCVITGALFPGQGYGMVLAKAFAMPGTRVRPGTVTPTGPAFSMARARLGEAAMRSAYELDAARDDVPLGAGGTAFGLELVVFDGTTLDLFSCPELAGEFGVPEGGTHPKLRVVALLQAGPCGGRPPPSAGTTTGRTPWPTSSGARSAPASSASPTGASSPWTGGCASPAAGRSCCGGSRTPPAPSRSRRSGR